MSVSSKSRSFLTTVGQVLWPGSGPRPDASGLSWGWRWTLHLVLLILFVVGLFAIGWFFELDRHIPNVPRVLARSWLPILFLLLYGMAWVAWYLWGLLAVPGEGPEFQDIYDAWQQAMLALKQAGIDVRETPLFLVLGRPESGEDSLFAAAQLQLPVRLEPRHPTAPIKVSANNEGIYVTCCGASLTGHYVAQLTATQVGDGGMGAMPMIPSAAEEDDPLLRSMGVGGATLMPGSGGGGGAEKIGALLAGAAREGRQLTPVERREARMLVRKDKAPHTYMRQVDANFHAARLAYLCRLIVGERDPRPPLNGVLMLIPFSGLDLPQDSADTGDVLQHDLATIHRVTRLTCPRFGMVADLETAPGFREFLQQFSHQERRPRLGQRCPLDPDLSRSAVTNPNSTPLNEMFNSLATWVCNGVVPTWVYKKFKTEKPDHPDPTESVKTNAAMFLFLEECRQRQARLGQVLARAADAHASTRAPWFGGLYVTGTGSNAAFEQGFVPGVVRRLIEEQDYIAWTDEAFAENENFNRLTTMFYLAAGVTAVLTVLLILWVVLGG